MIEWFSDLLNWIELNPAYAGWVVFSVALAESLASRELDYGERELSMLVVDPDKDTADDTLLPLSERQISLAPESFDTDSRRVTLRYRPFADLSPPTSNAMQFSFEPSTGSANRHHSWTPRPVTGKISLS